MHSKHPSQQPAMIVYNIVDDEFHAGDSNQPTVTIVGRTVIAVSRTIYIRCEISEEGLGFPELFRMMNLLRVRIAWLAQQLNRPEYGGIAGEIIANAAQINQADIDRARNGPLYASIMSRLVRPRIVEVNSVTDDETCVICQHTKNDDRSLRWAIASGCPRHMFHLDCIRPWRGSRCMICRAPLERA